MERVSDRHEADLGGQLLPFSDTRTVPVTVLIEEDSAHLPSTQHTAWMLLNLLARAAGVVDEIVLACPNGVPLAGRVVPLAARDMDLRSALLAGGEEIGIVPVRTGEAIGDILVVGPGDASIDSYRVYGEAWWGGVSAGAICGGRTSPLPFGPYAAACIAAGEVFKAARMRPGTYERPAAAFYSTWSHKAGPAPLTEGPDDVAGVTIGAALAGVGAVGSTWVHAIWACPGITGQVALADNDSEGVERTNLNRYPLFGSASLGHPKASEAARIAGDSRVLWAPHDRPFEELGIAPPRLISAVDVNRARAALQHLYPPRILAASTYDLRGEILRCGPPGAGACLRCFNPPEPIPPDEQVRARVRGVSGEELARLASDAGVAVEDALIWSREGRCGQAGERLLGYLRTTDEGPTRFAVGFVSVMAGTMLAAETIKDVIGAAPPLSDALQRAAFQFWHPTARGNGATPYGRDLKCPACVPGSPATAIWNRRFVDLEPSRRAPSRGSDDLVLPF